MEYCIKIFSKGKIVLDSCWTLYAKYKNVSTWKRGFSLLPDTHFRWRLKDLNLLYNSEVHENSYKCSWYIARVRRIYQLGQNIWKWLKSTCLRNINVCSISVHFELLLPNISLNGELNFRTELLFCKWKELRLSVSNIMVPLYKALRPVTRFLLSNFGCIKINVRKYK